MPGVKMDTAEQSIRKELEKLAGEGPTDYELQKVKNKVISNLVFGEIHYLNKAVNLAQFELMGMADEINLEPERYKAVTKTEIKELAGKIFNPDNCSTLYYLTENTLD
jgi:predicted Zn-dependent peptidase